MYFIMSTESKNSKESEEIIEIKENTMLLIECPICMNNLDKNNIIICCCNKSLHIECFMKCISLNNLCPFCRKEYILNDIKLKENMTDTVISIQNRDTDTDTDTVTAMNHNIFQCNNVLLLILLFFIVSRIVKL